MQEIHIGEQIKNHLKESGKSVTWLSKQINYERTKLYRIFQTAYIDTDVLFSISKHLKHDFFAQYSRRLSELISVSCVVHLLTKWSTKLCVLNYTTFFVSNPELFPLAA